MIDFDVPVAAGPERRSIAGLGKPRRFGAFPWPSSHDATQADGCRWQPTCRGDVRHSPHSPRHVADDRPSWRTTPWIVCYRAHARLTAPMPLFSRRGDPMLDQIARDTFALF